MKCVIKDEEVRRVKNDLAEKLVKEEGYSYCKKIVWKDKTRKSDK